MSRTVSWDEIREAELADDALGGPLRPHETAGLTDDGPDADPVERRTTTPTTRAA